MLKKVIVHYWKDYALAMAMMIAGGLSSIYSAKNLGLLVQEGLVKKDANASYYYAALVLILIATSVVLYWRAKAKLVEAAGKSIEMLRSALFDFIQKIKISFYDTTPLGKIVTRITHDVDSMEGFLSGSFAQYCVEGISFLLSVIALLTLAPRHGIMIVACFIPVFILTMVAHKPVSKLFKAEASFRSESNATLAEFIKGFFIIRCFGLENWAFDKYLSILEKLKKSRLRSNMFYTFFFPTASFLSYLPTIIHLGVGAFGVNSGDLPLYVFIAFFQYCSRLSSALNIFVHELQQVYNIVTCAGRVEEFLQSPIEFANENSDGQKPQTVRGEIEYQNVGMQYNDSSWALREVSFKIQQGEQIGLVGRTGSGKTTCINLLTRLYEFQEGKILIDGLDIRQWDPYYLRNCIGVVGQDVVLFKGTILENLTLGGDYTLEQVQSAVEMVGLSRVLKRNQMDLNTVLYDHGSNLSSGERQLVSIARIYLRSPKILIMDEATANIDPYYEKVIHQALYQLMEGKTCLLIAHRLETLHGSDRLFEFEQGRLKAIKESFESTAVHDSIQGLHQQN